MVPIYGAAPVAVIRSRRAFLLRAHGLGVIVRAAHAGSVTGLLSRHPTENAPAYVIMGPLPADPPDPPCGGRVSIVKDPSTSPGRDWDKVTVPLTLWSARSGVPV